MIETIIKCDKCGRPAKTYIIIIGKSMDASGNGYENNCRYSDFCFKHLIEYARTNKEYQIIEK